MLFRSGDSVFNTCMGIVNATTTNYPDLQNKPKINGVELVGDKTAQELNITDDKNFVFTQATPSTVWEINHNLNKYPAVIIVDDNKNIVMADVIYIDVNNITISFTKVFSGQAFLN